MSDASIEQQKIDLEIEKLDLERKKVDIELRKTKWTAISVAVPVFAGILTIFYGIWSTNRQAESQFELEIAKSIMSAPTSGEAAGRLEFYQYLFGKRVIANKEIPTDKIGDPAPRLKFFIAVANSSRPLPELYKIYSTLFGDDWVGDPALAKAMGAEQKAAPP